MFKGLGGFKVSVVGEMVDFLYGGMKTFIFRIKVKIILNKGPVAQPGRAPGF